MALRILLLLLLSAAATTAVDFSQFYLPPCCYAPASLTASSNINARYQKPDPKNTSSSPSGTIHLFDPDSKTASSSSSTSSSDTKPNSQPSTTKKSPTARARLYRYIIPVGLEKREPRTSPPDSVEAHSSSDLFRSPVSKKHQNIPTTQQHNNKSHLQKSIEKQLLSPAQVEPALVKRPLKPSRRTKPARDYLHESNTTSFNDVMSKHKRNIQRLHGLNETMVATHFDMPPNWATNLKRALFQSMDSLLSATQKKKSSSNNKSKDDETFEAKSSNHGNYQQTASSEQTPQRNSRRLSYLWPKIRDANFSYIEPLGKSATSLPQTLLMPSGQGPVASGVVVNTPDGIELRMSSELHFQQDDPNSEAGAAENGIACTCPLVANGEMLLAYWSVTRILNELGQNSLQYLIYPLAHNVPTPPRLQPFNTQIQITKPSQQYPIDPSQHFQGHQHISHHQNYEELPPQLSEAPTVTQDPRFVHNAQPEFPQNQVFQNLQRFTQIPQPVDDQNNFRSVHPNNRHRQVNLQQQLYSPGQQSFATGGPPLAHPNFIPVGHPLGQTLGTPTPPLYSTGRQAHRKPHATAPAHIQLFDGTTRPAELPKSIQDLLPFHQITTVQPPLGAVPPGLGGPQQIPNNFHNPAINQVVYNIERNPSAEYDSGVVNYANNRFPQPNIPQQQSHNFDYASIFSGIPPGSEINFHPASSLPFAGNPEFQQPVTYQDRSQEQEEYERFRPSTPVRERERGRDFDFNTRRNQQQPQQRPFYPEHPTNPVPLEGFPNRNTNRGRDNYYNRNNQFPVLRHRSDRYTTSDNPSRTQQQQPLDGRGYIIDF